MKAGVVDGEDGNPRCLEQAQGRVPAEGGPGLVGRVGRHPHALQALPDRQRRPVERLGVRVEVALPLRRRVDGAGGVGDGGVPDVDLRRVEHDRVAAALQHDDLCVHHVVRRQDREHREAAVHAVHPEVVVREHLVAAA